MFVVQLPHVPSPTVCLFSVSLLLHFYFLLFPSISINVGATNGVFLKFPNGFLLCGHGLDFWDRLMWEFNQINHPWINFFYDRLTLQSCRLRYMRLTDPRPFARVRAPCVSNMPKNENATLSLQWKYNRKHDIDTEPEDRKKHTISSMEKHNISTLT